MSSVRLNPFVNLFATPNEVGDWVSGWVERFGLNCLVSRHPQADVFDLHTWPFRSRNMPDEFPYKKIWLSIEHINPEGLNINSIATLGHTLLQIKLPIFASRGLVQGLFGLNSFGDMDNDVWDRIAGEFGVLTQEGMWGFFPSTGLVKYSRFFRYSAGAADLSRQGVKLYGAGDDTWYVERPEGLH
jgi:hypothetical protein